MDKPESQNTDPDMLDDYDFSNGVRGKYTSRFQEGTNLVALDPDVASVFTDSKQVNDALRSLADLAKRSAGKKIA